MIRALAQQ
ncbi:unnamed protein product, partial [Allacma fusca]